MGNFTQDEMEQIVQRAKIELARRDVGQYGEYVFHLKCLPHIRKWCDVLMDETALKTLIVCPPGHGKSTWISSVFPSWYVGRYPSDHILLLSHAADHAKKFSSAARNTIAESPDYKAVFPSIHPNRNFTWAQDSWYIERPDKGDPHPTMLASGYDGPVLGSRANLLILDDVMDEEVANSFEQRQKLKEFVKNTVFTRLTNAMDGRKPRIVCIMTRWNEDDLAAEFISNPEWRIIHMPAIGYWGENTALAPEIKTVPELLSIKNDPTNPDGGILRFENIYQGNPTVQKGTILQRAWWRRMPNATMPRREDCDTFIQVWDTGYKRTADSAYSVCLDMGLYRGDIIIYSMMRKKMEFPELLKTTRQLYALSRPRLVLIEDKASGQSLIQSLQQGIGANGEPFTGEDGLPKTIPLFPMKADSDPVAYVRAFSGFLEAHRCWLPDEGYWIEDFLTECSSFPSGKYKDIPMTWAHGMKYLTQNNVSGPLNSGAVVTIDKREEDPHLADWRELPGTSDMSDFLKEYGNA